MRVHAAAVSRAHSRQPVCGKRQERGCTPLHDAIDCGHDAMATLLLSRHAPADLRDRVRACGLGGAVACSC